MTSKTLTAGFLAAALLVTLFSGCYSPDLGGTCYQCGESDKCPDGSQCVAGICSGPNVCEMTCGSSLADAKTGDFSIAFDVTTKSTAQSTLLHQRSRCDGTTDFWSIVLLPAGTLTVELASPYASLTSTATVNDGRPHAVVVRRMSGALSIYVDNVPSGLMAAPQTLGMLPPLGIGRGNPCEAAGLKPLNGTVSNVCLWVRP